MAASWANFEATVDSYSVILSGVSPDIVVCFTAQIPGSGRKLDAYISLARLRGAPTEVIKALCKFAESTHKLAERRNRAVHDPWFLNSPENPQRLEITAQKTSVIAMREVSTEDVLKLAKDIWNHTERLDELAAKVGYPVPPTS